MLSNPDLSEFGDTLHSRIESGTLEIVGEWNTTAACHHVIVETNLFEEVGQERGNRTTLPAISTQLKRSYEGKDRVGTKLGMRRISVVRKKGSVEFLGMGDRLRGAGLGFVMTDQGTPFIGHKLRSEDRIHEIIFKFKNSDISRRLGDVGRVKDVVKPLGTSSGFELEVPGAPEATIRERRKVTDITLNGFLEEFRFGRDRSGRATAGSTTRGTRRGAAGGTEGQHLT